MLCHMWGESHNKQRKSNKNKYGDGTGESEVESHDEDDVREEGGWGWLIIMQDSHTRATHAPIRVESRSI